MHILAILIVGLMVFVEIRMGRSVQPKDLRLWRAGSQDCFDWYSLSHMIHGMLLYALFRDTGGWSVVLCTLVECLWEIVENSPWVIARYRKTASDDYNGDSVVNSVCDVLCMIAGGIIAIALPWYATTVVGVLFELLALWAVRDNLTLNVLMLVYPFPAIKRWQKQLY